ncbi:uncharacterized protein LOC143581927 [Bidens hawaiensis]|uniref:uncharacterized protein LOC143581927 n=1 Tax=Bidens hawaiensis TaxID=980011 RepID=UPI00404AE73E
MVKIEKSLATAQASLTGTIKGHVGNGFNILFWLDAWLTDDTLKNRFPTLFSLEGVKSCVVVDRVKVNDGRWEDNWVWGGDASGSFSVASMKKLLYRVDPPCPKSILKLNNWVPMKVNVIVWRALQNRLPNSDNLIKRKMFFGPDIYSNCLAAEESLDQIFTSCYVATMVWQRIGKWCSIQPFQVKGVQDLIEVVKLIPGTGHKRKLVYSVVMVAIWCLWKVRNEYIFENKPVKIVKELGDIKVLSFKRSDGATC